AKNQLACRRRRVDCGTLTSENPQTDASAREVMHHVHEVPKTASEPIQLPHDKRIAFPERLQACNEARPVIFLPRRGVAVEVTLGYTCGKQCVPLQVEHL